MRVAVAYLRKSKVTSDRHVSWEVQESQIRALAERNGDKELTILSDWGSSGAASSGAFGGTGRGGRRKVWGQLTEAIESGSVLVLYAYSLSRLARSTRELLALAELCSRVGVPIRLAKEGDLDFATSHGRLYLTVLAAVATFEAEVGAERARDHVALRRSRGDHIGRAPFGYVLDNGQLVLDPAQPLTTVLDAYREKRSYTGAAKVLNAAGVVGPQGGSWSNTTVRKVVIREAPEDVITSVTATRRGASGKRSFMLTGLLRCHCGTVMTGARDHVGDYGPYVSYLCWRARYDDGHGRPLKVAENVLRPWIQDEAARLHVPPVVSAVVAANDELRSQLHAKRERVIDMYVEGVISKADRDSRLDVIDRELDDVDTRLEVITVPPAIDWSWAPSSINEVLHTIWDHVDLDAHLRPLEAVWRVPEWRSARDASDLPAEAARPPRVSDSVADLAVVETP